MKPRSSYQPAVHRMALTTTCVALLPMAVGALVTTMQAGMAFRDWPNSDGQFMLTYPWLADLLNGAMNKFVEHGHRLAGMLIGLTSLLLVIVTWCRETRLWVRWMSVAVLGCVILQGLLGGGRVLADDPRLAMVHGNFAAIVFCLMGALTLVTSRQWMSGSPRINLKTPLSLGRGAGGEGKSVPKPGFSQNAGFATRTHPSPQPTFLPMRGTQTSDHPLPRSFVLKALAVAAPMAIYGQYLLGGRQRHLHDMLHEHLAGAVIACVCVTAFALCAFRTGVGWFRRLSLALMVLLLLQLALGAGAWVTKFGFPPTGYVAVQGTPLQLFVRSSHTVVAMLLLMTSVVLGLRVFRFTADFRTETAPSVSRGSVGPLSMPGGAG